MLSPECVTAREGGQSIFRLRLMVNAAYPRSRSQVAAMAGVKMPMPVGGKVVISHRSRHIAGVSSGQLAITDLSAL